MIDLRWDPNLDGPGEVKTIDGVFLEPADVHPVVWCHVEHGENYEQELEHDEEDAVFDHFLAPV